MAEGRVFEYRLMGMSHKQIAEALERDHGVSVGKVTVSHDLKRLKGLAKGRLKALLEKIDDGLVKGRTPKRVSV